MDYVFTVRASFQFGKTIKAETLEDAIEKLKEWFDRTIEPRSEEDDFLSERLDLSYPLLEAISYEQESENGEIVKYEEIKPVVANKEYNNDRL